MKSTVQTLLLLSNSADTQRLLNDILGPETNIVLLSAPAEPTGEKFEGMIAGWLRMAEVVVVDAVSLGETARWAIEAVRGTRLEERHAVVVRATAFQQTIYPFNADWLVLSELDSAEHVKESLRMFLDLRKTQTRLKQAEAIIDRQRCSSGLAASGSGGGSMPSTMGGELGGIASASPVESYRYRDALKSLARLLGQRPDESLLLWEFMGLVAELLGVSKVALFVRQFQVDPFGGQSGPVGNQFVMAASRGVSQEVVGHLRLRLESGLGGALLREAKVLRRARQTDPLALNYDSQVAREFELLGTEVAVPVFDNDQLLGILTFGGKIVGESVTNLELELVYSLMSQLAQAIRNLHLMDQVGDQQRFMGEVLSNVSTGVVVLGPDGRILFLNKQASQVLGLGTKELVGQKSSGLPPMVADAVYEALVTPAGALRREVILPPENRPLGIHATRIPVRLGESGREKNCCVAVGLIEDLTESRLRQSQARELSEKEFFMRMASQMSHELKNSMVTIKMFAQELPDHYQEADFRERFQRLVTNDVGRMDQLVNALSCFAQPMTLTCEGMDQRELVENTLKNIEQEFSRKRLARVLLGGEGKDLPADLPAITISKEFAIKTGKVEGDRIRLQQAFEQVTRNALQAMPAGGRLVISVTEAEAADCPGARLPAGGAVRVEWRDAGEGISLENLKRVTEPFFTTRTVGAGLGLAMVKKIVEQHQGRLEIDSTLGRGTSVVIVLPLKQPATAAAAPLPIPKDADVKPSREHNRVEALYQAVTSAVVVSKT